MKFLNLKINFYLFIADFFPHVGSLCCFFFHNTKKKESCFVKEETTQKLPTRGKKSAINNNKKKVQCSCHIRAIFIENTVVAR